MVAMRRVWNGNMYKLFGITITNECNNFVVHEGGDKKDRTPTVSGEKTMLWHQRLRYIRKKGLRALQGKGMVEDMTDCTLDFDL